jgi:hypothetical protein
MVDPVSMVGLVSACLQIASQLITTTRDINSLAKSYKSFQASLSLVESRIITIRAAVSELQQWYFAKNHLISEELGEGLESALISCATVLKGIQAQFEKIRGSRNRGIRYIWEEKDIKLHERNLDSQITALHLLVSVLQLYVLPISTLKQKLTVKSSPTSGRRQHQITMEALQTSLRQASDDASSYIERDRADHMASDSFSVLTDNFNNLQIEFPFDESIVNSNAYRKAFRTYLSVPAEQHETGELSSNVSNGSASPGKLFLDLSRQH